MLSAPPYWNVIGRIRQLQRLLAGILLLGLCGCVSLDDHETSHQSLALEVRSEMARCVDAQKASDRQLDRQSEQLGTQAVQLSELAAKLNALEAGQQNVAQSVSPAASACAVAESSPGKMMVGRQESVWLEDFQLSLPARVDTGAETASLDARNIELFERDGDAWVRFEIVHPDSGEAIPLERELVRKARIVQASSERAERRPVIRLGIVIGSVRQQAEFTLSNRSHLDYQVLVGRNILSDVMVVDVSQTNIAPPIGALNPSGSSESP